MDFGQLVLAGVVGAISCVITLVLGMWLITWWHGREGRRRIAADNRAIAEQTQTQATDRRGRQRSLFARVSALVDEIDTTQPNRNGDIIPSAVRRRAIAEFESRQRAAQAADAIAAQSDAVAPVPPPTPRDHLQQYLANLRHRFGDRAVERLRIFDVPMTAPLDDVVDAIFRLARQHGWARVGEHGEITWRLAKITSHIDTMIAHQLAEQQRRALQEQQQLLMLQGMGMPGLAGLVGSQQSSASQLARASADLARLTAQVNAGQESTARFMEEVFGPLYATTRPEQAAASPEPPSEPAQPPPPRLPPGVRAPRKVVLRPRPGA